MVNYDPKNWLGVIFRLKGSVLPRLLPRTLLVAAVGGLAAWLFVARGFKLPMLAHSLVGVALGLLLVFRTNASFDRWWEGRKLLGLLVNRTRDLTRQAAHLIEGEDEAAHAARREVQRMVSAFFVLLGQYLRNEQDLAPVERLLGPGERAFLEPIKHRPLAMASRLSAKLAELARAGRLTEQRLQLMDANLTSLIDSMGACERIFKTPVPFAYAQHIKTFLTLFAFTAPFALAEAMTWTTPVAAALLAFALFGIDEIGVEIEDPFGYDDNDLPLEAIAQGIESSTGETIEHRPPAPVGQAA